MYARCNYVDGTGTFFEGVVDGVNGPSHGETFGDHFSPVIA